MTYDNTTASNAITGINKQQDLFLLCHNSPCCIEMSGRRPISGHPNVGITAWRGTSCIPNVGICGGRSMSTNYNVVNVTHSSTNPNTNLGIGARRATDCNPNIYLLVKKCAR